MAQITVDLPENTFNELKERAEKRELSLEEYVVKALRWHLKEVKKIEAGLEERAQQFNFVTQNLKVEVEPDASD